MPRRRVAPEEEARHTAPREDEMPRGAVDRGIAFSTPARKREGSGPGNRDRDKLGDPARDEDERAEQAEIEAPRAEQSRSTARKPRRSF